MKRFGVLICVLIVTAIATFGIPQVAVSSLAFHVGGSDFLSNPSAVAVSLDEDSWPQIQRDASHSGYAPQTIGPPYREVWRTEVPPVSSRIQPVIAEGLIFLPSNDHSLYALHAADGQIAWSYLTDGPLVNSAAYANGRVFLGSTDRAVYALRASDGTLIWRYQTGGPIKTAPVLAVDSVFIGSSDGYMVALDQETGTVRWRYDTGVPIYDTAAYDSGMVFFGGMDSVGYALDAQTGDLVWSLPIPGQGFRDRWTVAGNGHVFFTPMLYGSYHIPLRAAMAMFREGAVPQLYDQPWTVQRQAILAYLSDHRYHQPLFVVDQATGQESFVPPVLYASGGSQSPHSQPVLLPNGNANVVYRRSFGTPELDGELSSNKLFVGELDLATGDVIPVDRCQSGAGGWVDCGNYKSALTPDESSSLMRSGDVIYLDGSRGTHGLDTVNQTGLPATACYSDSAPPPFYVGDCIVTFDQPRMTYDSLRSEVSSDGNDFKRPSPLVGNRFYILHYDTLVVVEGTAR